MEVTMSSNEDTTRHHHHDAEPETATWRRHQSARLARHFSIAAFRQCERAVSGIIAVPTALALGGAAGALFVAALIEGGFELFEGTITDVGRRLSTHDMNGAHGRFVEPPQARA
jgi:hypothetical protein